MNYPEGSLAVVATEAGLVIDPAVGGELIHQVYRLLARLALLGRPSKRPRRHLSPSLNSSSKDNTKSQRERVFVVRGGR